MLTDFQNAACSMRAHMLALGQARFSPADPNLREKGGDFESAARLARSLWRVQHCVAADTAQPANRVLPQWPASVFLGLEDPRRRGKRSSNLRRTTRIVRSTLEQV